MSRIISTASEAVEADITDEMYRARKRLFVDRLKWKLAVDDRGRERDRFDRLSPVYLIDLDDRGGHRGSVRLLPTTGDTVLGDLIAEMMDGVPIASPSVWEFTRFCVTGREAPDPGVERSGVERIAVDLMLAICETCIAANVGHVVGSFDRSLHAIFTRNGWVPDLLGRSDNSRNPVYLGIWATTAESAVALRAAGGTSDPVVGS